MNHAELGSRQAVTDDTIRLRALSPRRENLRQLLRRNHLELLVGAILWLLVRTPATELRGVTEAIALHVIVRNLEHQLGTNRLPRQIFAATPATLATGHPMWRVIVLRKIRPVAPGMTLQRVLAIGL